MHFKETCCKSVAKMLKKDAESSLRTYDKAIRSLPLHTSTQRCDRCTCTHAHTHTHTPIQRYNRRFFSLCPHTPTQLYTIAADDMCTCMFLYVYLVMKNHIECDQLLHKSRALKNYTWLQFVIEIFKSEIQLFTFHKWQPLSLIHI